MDLKSSLAVEDWQAPVNKQETSSHSEVRSIPNRKLVAERPIILRCNSDIAIVYESFNNDTECADEDFYFLRLESF